MIAQDIQYEIAERVAAASISDIRIASFKGKRAPRFGMLTSRDMPPFHPWWPEGPFR